MPVFFFHHYGPDATLRDDIGCSFESLELAYLDAYRSMIEIGADLLKRQEDPFLHRIEIADPEARVLVDLHFSEVFCRRSPPRWTDAQTVVLRERLQHAEKLKAELRDVCVSARKAVATAHEILRRAKAAV